MEKINDGGRAFPLDNEHREDLRQKGMTLRQWYAGQALNGLISKIGSHPDAPIKNEGGEELLNNTAFELAESSFKYADAMIKFERL